VFKKNVMKRDITKEGSINNNKKKNDTGFLVFFYGTAFKYSG